MISVDPITAQYPELTPYQVTSNSPIYMVEIEGLEGKVFVYSERIKGAAFIGRHSYIIALTETQATRVVIELYGPGGGGMTGQPRILPLNSNESRTKNSTGLATGDIIRPIGQKANENFEQNIIKYAEHISNRNIDNEEGVTIDNPLMPIYDPMGTNSNSYVTAIVRMAGGDISFSIKDKLFSWNPGFEDENVTPVLNMLIEEFGQEEFDNNHTPDPLGPWLPAQIEQDVLKNPLEQDGSKPPVVFELEKENDED